MKSQTTTLPYTERVKLLKERLAYLRSPKIKYLQKPAKVAAAEKIVNDWEDKNQAHVDEQRAKHRARLHEIQDAAMLGDMDRAVKLIKALEI